jgi:transposase
MTTRQPLPDLLASSTLHAERLGPLPVINHFLDRLGLQELLERFVPTVDKRVRLPFAVGLGVLLRSILVEREAIYRQQETVEGFAPAVFGLSPELQEHLCDDAIGHALDHLFDADRASLLTEVVIAASRRFDLCLDELHNDSTSIRFCGQYQAARGRSIRGKKAPFVTYGQSKDHRGDLKQLLFILTTARDGAVPVQFRSEAGNSNDDRTHQETWNALCRATGRKDFLYVADSKLCNREALDHIDQNGGRLVCVVPRSRLEDKEFRKWIQTNTPTWELVRDRRNPRRRGGLRDRWWAFRYPTPSREGWPVIWICSSLAVIHQEQTRRERIAKAEEKLKALADKLAGPRPRRRARKDIEERIEHLLGACRVQRYIKTALAQEESHSFRQAGPGRPGPSTRYVRKTRRFWRLIWEIDQAAIAYDRKSDGMYPLLTNSRALTNAEVFEAHKRQPSIERRFEQLKSVFEIAPVLLKNEGRIEAFFFLYFLALFVQALIEREIRRAMARDEIESLPIYPEDRLSERPTVDQIFRLFSHVARHELRLDGRVLRTFEPELTSLQAQVLHLLGVSQEVYVRPA